MKRSSQKWTGVMVAVALGVCVLPALVSLLAHGRLFAGRLFYPLDLEWMEGGMLIHAERIASGQGIYVAPSMEFIPYLYTPLYPALLALLSYVFPLGYVLGRTVSIVAFACTLVVVVVAAVGEVREGLHRGWAALVGIAGAGTVAAGFAFTGNFYDLVRADSLLLLLEAAALWLALRGAGWPSAMTAGLFIALGFFTKQTAAIVGLGMGVGLLLANPRRALVFGFSAAIAVGLGCLLLMRTSGGWFWFYVFQLHQRHPFSWSLALGAASVATLKHLWPIFLALAMATVVLARMRKLSRADAIPWATALAGQMAALVGFGTKWAFANAFIPAVFFSTFAAVVLSARLVGEAWASRGRLASLAATAAVVLLAWQTVHAQRPLDEKTLPGEQDRASASRLLSELRSLPGPLFIPSHSYYGVLAGKHPFVHRIGLLDVDTAFGMREQLAASIRNQRFGAIVLDWRPRPGEWPTLESAYHLLRELDLGDSSVGMFAGVQTAPHLLLVPTAPPPPLPPHAQVFADFESGTYDGFLVDGEAMGRAPAPAPLGMFGRFAVDSTRAGAAARGRLLSGNFAIERPNLAFTLAGPADAKLRVVLYLGETAVRSASPSGTVRREVWDVGDLVGQSAEILIEDDSSQAGLAVDQFVAY